MSKLWIPLFATLTIASSCSNGPSNTEDQTKVTESTAPPESAIAPSTQEETLAAEPAPEPAGDSPAAEAMATEVAAAFDEGMLVGIVKETMDAGGYTYVKLNTPEGDMWAAGPPTKLTVGRAAGLGDSFLMEKFESAALGRTFDKIYFCSTIQTADTLKAQPAAAHPETPKAEEVKSEEVKQEGAIARAENGQTIGEVIANSADYVGKEVTIRARVVKYSAAIMKMNWIHLQDGTGEEGKNDLTVTTAGTAAVGDIVLIKGTLIANKDFGFGYKYDLIIEDAAVTVQ